ncbi:hypothetical protein [Promicromonospora sp. NPDC023987]|uniref:hypothetical protein n=1 Tax=Promicromonospora sp. NPDC023987 TaxID=3155360 RepID=UPI0033F1EE28
MSLLPDQLLLTEDMVELVMRLLLAGEIDRTVACQFVSPWVEGTLPSTRQAESGAQTLHGLDLVRDELGRVWHPRCQDPDLRFEVGQAEMVRRCEKWLSSNGRRGSAR